MNHYQYKMNDNILMCASDGLWSRFWQELYRFHTNQLSIYNTWKASRFAKGHPLHTGCEKILINNTWQFHKELLFACTNNMARGTRWLRVSPYCTIAYISRPIHYRVLLPGWLKKSFEKPDCHHRMPFWWCWWQTILELARKNCASSFTWHRQRWPGLSIR